MRTVILILAVIGSYLILRGWPDAPGLLLRCSLAVALLVIGLAVWGLRGKKESHQLRMTNMRKASIWDYLSLGIAVIFAEACLVVFTGTMVAPAQQIAYMVHDQVSFLNSENNEGGIEEDVIGKDLEYGGDKSGPWIFSKNLERDLPKHSNHKPTNKPEIFIELENPESVKRLLKSRVYVSSFAFSQFNGVAWSAAPIARSTLRAPIRFEPPSNDQPLIKHRIFHAVNPTGQNVFSSIHNPISTNVDELTRLAESIYQLPSTEDENDGYSYIATSQPVVFDKIADQNLTPADALEGELLLPLSMLDRIRDTSQRFNNQPDTVSQLRAIRKYLRENYQYSLQTTNQDGINPLENFLYQEQRGYCEHFATAAAMFCRALGIPSRVAYGWSGGRFYPGQNMLVFRAKDAHAWTEIKIQGYGWVVFDTTPPDNNATPETSEAPENEEAPDLNELIDANSDDSSISGDSPGMELELDLNYSKILLGLGLMCICAFTFIAVRYFHRNDSGSSSLPVSHTEYGYFIQFKQACAALGQPFPLGRTLRQHIQVLAKSKLAPEFSDILLGYHYQINYGQAKRDLSEEKQLSKQIREWKQKHSSIK